MNSDFKKKKIKINKKKKIKKKKKKNKIKNFLKFQPDFRFRKKKIYTSGSKSFVW